MKKELLKDIIYSGLSAIAQNKTYYYHSTVDSRYSHFQENGRDEVLEFVKMMAELIIEIEDEEISEHAKKMVMDGLKS